MRQAFSHGCLLLFLLGWPTLRLQAQTPLEAVITNVTVGHCTDPHPSVNNFLPTDPKAEVFFRFASAPAGSLSLKWFGPNSTIDGGGWDNISQFTCFIADLGIAGTNVANQLGNWHVEVYLNGNTIVNIPFHIGAIEPRGPQYEGYFDTNATDCSHFGGWAHDLGNPGAIVSVDISVSGFPLVTVQANQSRDGLTGALAGHAWNLYNLQGFENGQTHEVHVYFSGTTQELTTPQATSHQFPPPGADPATCGGGGTPSVTWTASPPSTFRNGDTFTVKWHIDSVQGAYSHVHVGLSSDVASNPLAKSTALSGLPGDYQQLIDPSSILGLSIVPGTPVYFAVHVATDPSGSSSPPNYYSNVSSSTVAGSPTTNTTTVFVIHGIRQSSADMSSLGTTLETLVPKGQYVIDTGFDFKECAQSCQDGCSIEKGAAKLASYIGSKQPSGPIILIGYSMGGLIARDMIVNQRSSYHVVLLVTLGTPNLGYAFESVDDFFTCNTLAAEMYGDFQNMANPFDFVPEVDYYDDNGNHVSTSPYLAALNLNWAAGNYNHPEGWLAASGTFCGQSNRNPFISQAVGAPGCRTGGRNDGVVCEESARFLWAMSNEPTKRWADDSHQYGHVDEGVLYCSLQKATFTLYNPPLSGDLMKTVASAITSPPPKPAAIGLSFSSATLPLSADGQWHYSVVIKESAGVGANITNLIVDGVDYSSSIVDWFGTSRLGARGELSTQINSWGYSPGYNLFWKVSGTDDTGAKVSATNWIVLEP